MAKPKVAVIRYEEPYESVRKAVELSRGLEGVSSRSRVFIKPNVVFWTRSTLFPKYGVITTSRVVQDMVRILRERGVEDITIGEGGVVFDPKDKETSWHAFESLGYNELKKRYGVKVINVHERPFQKINLDSEITVNVNTDILESDFVVNIPVLKTHAQTKVSLGIKNLKGLLDINSRKKCHSIDPGKDLHYMVSKLSDCIPPGFTLLDGIFTNERGPAFDGKMRRSNILVASSDTLSADKVGARLLGYEPSDVPHIALAATGSGRTTDLSDLELSGVPLEELALKLEYSFPYNEDNSLPLPMKKMGIEGLSYWKYDLTMCTYCSLLTGIILTAVAYAWKGVAWDDVEVLTGKLMKPTPGKKHSILIGKCLYEANKNHPDIGKMITIKTCPPRPDAILKAFQQVGIDLNPAVFEHMDQAPGFYLRKYEGKPEFDDSFFRVE
ncbi:DUF362 domain-containing protein [Desulfomonile tiedjei]|uniref:DUF362 domain-containing protein n=1 Tax=Desulfomonile tiedjei (strain ATCC 49306 / DSM 6799 / DCB-1) TaxID=706587 RepID=I4CA32_DESTA|nr:DUF362 domain-containing protein [Desulfomonile tiedjei]AFM26423.1 hypothetical protein Desti_3781 [Desulfomonile tiedjei DSM 6799]